MSLPAICPEQCCTADGRNKGDKVQLSPHGYIKEFDRRREGVCNDAEEQDPQTNFFRDAVSVR